MNAKKTILSLLFCLSCAMLTFGQAAANAALLKKAEGWKKEVIAGMDGRAKEAQVMVDQVFSFAELGFQETETSAYLTGILEKNGFRIERGIAGIPTSWTAKWGSGKPVIALGSDIDCIPKASQMPGVVYKQPIVEGAPGHGEGHNSGQAVIILAALELKKIMEREHLSGTLMIWPGVAEEQIGSKAWYIRDGYFKDVDACIFTHVASNLSVGWGVGWDNGLVSVQYSFSGEAAHAAGAPWRGKSALDAVELMNVGWNYHREHLKPTQRSHYVITDGGDQPNVVPSKAAVWYYFRERKYADIKSMYEDADRIAQGASLMTGTTWTKRVVGTAWPGHFNKTIAETVQKNINTVGLPKWTDDDQRFARAVQKLCNAPKTEDDGTPIDGMSNKVDSLRGPVKFSWGGGSDDIADISWNVPTVVLGYPSNVPGTPGHSWYDAIAMATPVAHKGVVAGGKVVASTVIDLLTQPKLLADAWDYFRNVQNKDEHYIPFIDKDTPPATFLNKAIMDKFRPEMKKFYYDPSKYNTYLEQLGVKYPQIEKPADK